MVMVTTTTITELMLQLVCLQVSCPSRSKENQSKEGIRQSSSLFSFELGSWAMQVQVLITY